MADFSGAFGNKPFGQDDVHGFLGRFGPLAGSVFDYFRNPYSSVEDYGDRLKGIYERYYGKDAQIPGYEGAGQQLLGLGGRTIDELLKGLPDAGNVKGALDQLLSPDERGLAQGYQRSPQLDIEKKAVADAILKNAAAGGRLGSPETGTSLSQNQADLERRDYEDYIKRNTQRLESGVQLGLGGRQNALNQLGGLFGMGFDDARIREAIAKKQLAGGEKEGLDEDYSLKLSNELRRGNVVGDIFNSLGGILGGGFNPFKFLGG